MTLANKSLGYKILGFFIWPFGAYLISLKDIKSRSSIIILFLFFVLFGYTFLPLNEAADSFRYAQEFNTKTTYSLREYISDFNEYITFSSRTKDFYVKTCSFIVKAFGGGYHTLMALFATIFSFFYLKSFSFLTKRHEFKLTYVCYLLAFLFVFSNPIFNINGVRFWTAAWITVYAFFEILVNKKYIYLGLLFVTPIVHISFFLILVITLLFLFLKKFIKAWIIAFIVSFLFSSFVFIIIEKFRGQLPITFQNLLWSYTDENNLNDKFEKAANLPLYAKILLELPYFFINILIIVFISNLRKIKKNSTTLNVFSFVLVLMAFVNFTYGIPSVGNRFIQLAVPFIAFLCVIFYRQIPSLKNLIYCIPIIYSYYVLRWFRNMESITDPFLYLSTLVDILFKF